MEKTPFNIIVNGNRNSLMNEIYIFHKDIICKKLTALIYNMYVLFVCVKWDGIQT